MTLLQHELTDFKVNAFQNNEFHEVTKDDVLGHWSLFFFYPADFTFVCPTELEDLAENYAKFKEIGCEIYSVSCDTHFVHKAWHDANEKIAKIEYPMLADPTALLAKDLDRMFSTDIRAYGGTCLRTGVRAADRGSAFEKRGWADLPDRARAGCQ